jgi:hypothetical protein
LNPATETRTFFEKVRTLKNNTLDVRTFFTDIEKLCADSLKGKSRATTKVALTLELSLKMLKASYAMRN